MRESLVRKGACGSSPRARVNALFHTPEGLRLLLEAAGRMAKSPEPILYLDAKGQLWEIVAVRDQPSMCRCLTHPASPDCYNTENLVGLTTRELRIARRVLGERFYPMMREENQPEVVLGLVRKAVERWEAASGAEPEPLQRSCTENDYSWLRARIEGGANQKKAIKKRLKDRFCDITRVRESLMAVAGYANYQHNREALDDTAFRAYTGMWPAEAAERDRRYHESRDIDDRDHYRYHQALQRRGTLKLGLQWLEEAQCEALKARW